jgi:hypothetical protein
MIKLTQQRLFRNTPNVTFSDIGVTESNGLDLVEHVGRSVSPPDNDLGVSEWYIHTNQIDNNRVIKGQRLFELWYPVWEQPHWLVFLDETQGALQIPAGCMHRSYSGVRGSLLLNHAIRNTEYDEAVEFIPVPTTAWLKKQLNNPVYYNITQYEADFFIKWGRLP